ncbi:MipA/OmpV family protein [Paracoccus sp. MC1854]|uniref:MipA/OmpV family protein n=1 Tax=Paracoccus sp. MC1854 TaxID=2760306 RepID=UPI0015FFBAAC|nr:MipA/OmpV family protein [Paracoccus sp. MC1854]MBB1490383.1 MipA/OmpV family protein [Paracoccus sp. MC1854]
MRASLPLLLAALALPLAAHAQDGWGLAADIGLGAEVEPDWLGSDDMETSPWVIFRNLDVMAPGQPATRDGSSDGLRVVPTINWRSGRDADDSDALTGLDDIDRTIEAGVRFRYTQGPASGYLVVRKGFDGHEGLVGAVGAKYRIAPNDRLTIWPGIEGKFGDDRFTRTFFGVTGDESLRSGYAAYRPDGGFYAVGASIEARYALSPTLAVVGEAEYSRLTGDAADAPFIEEKDQPALRIGLVNRFSLRF